jgi:hypothetical protein
MARATRPKAALGVERIDVPGVLARAGIMHAAILAAAAMFVSPPITMAAFLLLLEAATAAQAATLMKTRGLASVRDTKVDALWTGMKVLKTYVQGLCDATDATTAIALIEGAGLMVAKSTTVTKLPLTAKYVTATGIVRLVVNKTLLLGKRTQKKTTFTWFWSADGGKTWSPGVTTGYAHLDVPNLPPGSYQFRVFASVGDVPGDPIGPAPLTIH